MMEIEKNKEMNVDKYGLDGHSCDCLTPVSVLPAVASREFINWRWNNEWVDGEEMCIQLYNTRVVS